MANISSIEWTDATWNPVTGCTKVSPGCKYCYAERLSVRLAAMGNRRYRNGFSLSLHEDLLELPMKWRQPRRVFVNSMSDLYHEDIPDEYVKAVFEVMNRASWHNFQILTKRPERLADLAADVTWSPNIWQGVSVESPEYLWRIPHLRYVPARIRFLSLEPLLAALPQLPLEGVHWVIVGGESGPRRRPIMPDWVRDIRDQCRSQRVPFFFKQWGGFNSKSGGCLLDGHKWQEWPESHSRLPSRAIGNSLGVVLPKEVIRRLRTKEGEPLFLIEAPNGGYQLTPYDPAFEKKMAKADDIMGRYCNTLHVLAK